eukprot:1175740-Prorocentrum_minimum.AAC.3
MGSYTHHELQAVSLQKLLGHVRTEDEPNPAVCIFPTHPEIEMNETNETNEMNGIKVTEHRPSTIPD